MGNFKFTSNASVIARSLNKWAPFSSLGHTEQRWNCTKHRVDVHPDLVSYCLYTTCLHQIYIHSDDQYDYRLTRVKHGDIPKREYYFRPLICATFAQVPSECFGKFLMYHIMYNLRGLKSRKKLVFARYFHTQIFHLAEKSDYVKYDIDQNSSRNGIRKEMAQQEVISKHRNSLSIEFQRENGKRSSPNGYSIRFIIMSHRNCGISKSHDDTCVYR